MCKSSRQPNSHPSSSLTPPALTYEPGKIDAQGAFTAEIHIAARVSPQDVWNDQQHGSQVMGQRPGMYLKYLPCRFHEVSGAILTGGAYLFRTLAEAEAYDDWTTNEFQVGDPKTTFWKQPLFESVRHWSWEVVGAHNFAPVAKHAIIRFQRWSYNTHDRPATKAADVASLVRQLYPVLKDAAEKRGATSFWLLHRPQDRMIAAQMTFAKGEGEDYDSIREAVMGVGELPSIGHIFPDAFSTEVLLDRTSPLLAVWLPMAESAKGVKVACPIFPDLKTGDA